MNQYVCCLCGESMDDTKETITSLLVTANWEKTEDEQESQQMFCHMGCLKKALHDEGYLYIGE